MEKLFIIHTIRPLRGKYITHTIIRHSEKSKDEYVADMTKKFGAESIVKILEYELKRVLK